GGFFPTLNLVGVKMKRRRSGVDNGPANLDDSFFVQPTGGGGFPKKTNRRHRRLSCRQASGSKVTQRVPTFIDNLAHSSRNDDRVSNVRCHFCDLVSHV